MLISRQIICQTIRNFNLDNICKRTYDQLVEQVNHKNFTVIKSKIVNPACGYYAAWVIEAHKYLKRKFEGYESEEEPEPIVIKAPEPPIISIPVTYHPGGRVTYQSLEHFCEMKEKLPPKLVHIGNDMYFVEDEVDEYENLGQFKKKKRPTYKIIYKQELTRLIATGKFRL